MVKAALAQGIAESGDKKCAEVLPEIVDFEGEGHRLKQLESPSFQKWKSYNVSLFFFKKWCAFGFLAHAHFHILTDCWRKLNRTRQLSKPFGIFSEWYLATRLRWYTCKSSVSCLMRQAPLWQYKLTVGPQLRCLWSCQLSNGTKLATSRVLEFVVHRRPHNLGAQHAGSHTRTPSLATAGWNMSRACALTLIKPSPLRALGMRTKRSNNTGGRLFGLGLCLRSLSVCFPGLILSMRLNVLMVWPKLLAVSVCFLSLVNFVFCSFLSSWPVKRPGVGFSMASLLVMSCWIGRTRLLSVIRTPTCTRPLIPENSFCGVIGLTCSSLLLKICRWLWPNGGRIMMNHRNVPWNDNTPLIKSLRHTLSKLLCRFDNTGRVVGYPLSPFLVQSPCTQPPANAASWELAQITKASGSELELLLLQQGEGQVWVQHSDDFFTRTPPKAPGAFWSSLGSRWSRAQILPGPSLCNSLPLFWFRCFTTRSRRLHVARIQLLCPMLHQSMTLQACRSFDQFGRGLDRILCDLDPQLRLSTPSKITILDEVHTFYITPTLRN